MKNFKVTMVLIGLTGKYTSEFIVRARNEKSATNKAYEHVGDRSLESMTVKEEKLK